MLRWDYSKSQNKCQYLPGKRTKKVSKKSGQEVKAPYPLCSFMFRLSLRKERYGLTRSTIERIPDTDAELRVRRMNDLTVTDVERYMRDGTIGIVEQQVAGT